MTNTISCLLTEDNDMEAYARAENIRYAWQRWAEETCIEWNGDHIWELELYHPEDMSGIDLACTYCGASLDTFGPDLNELVYADVGGVHIEAGKHDSPKPMVIPVTVAVEWIEHKSFEHGSEWDVDVILAQRGPAREVEA